MFENVIIIYPYLKGNKHLLGKVKSFHYNIMILFGLLIMRKTDRDFDFP